MRSENEQVQQQRKAGGAAEEGAPGGFPATPLPEQRVDTETRPPLEVQQVGRTMPGANRGKSTPGVEECTGSSKSRSTAGRGLKWTSVVAARGSLFR